MPHPTQCRGEVCLARAIACRGGVSPPFVDIPNYPRNRGVFLSLSEGEACLAPTMGAYAIALHASPSVTLASAFDLPEYPANQRRAGKPRPYVDVSAHNSRFAHPPVEGGVT